MIANKWSVRILYSLLQAYIETMRFSQVQKALGGITQRELTKHLREFEKAGIVARTVFPQIPPRVEYTVTPLGDSLFKAVGELSRWAGREWRSGAEEPQGVLKPSSSGKISPKCLFR